MHRLARRLPLRALALAAVLASCKRTCGEAVNGSAALDLDDAGEPAAAASASSAPAPRASSSPEPRAAFAPPPAPPPGPRPLAPLSGGRTTTRRPTFRVALPSPGDAATVELCRDRACSAVLASAPVKDGAAVLAKDLEDGTWYWRVRSEGSESATWQVSIPSRSTPVDTSILHGFDLNGDGYADVVADAYVFFGAPSGLPTRPSELLPDFSPDDCVLRDNGMIDQCAAPSSDVARLVGDVNGDGFADVLVAEAESEGGASLYFGEAHGISPMRAPSPAVTAEPLGDVDGDGYADVGSVEAGSVAIDFGGPTGFAEGRRVLLPGTRVESAGDVNGDGYADVMIDRGDGNAVVYTGGQRGLAKTGAVIAAPAVDAPKDATGAPTAGPPVFVAGGDMNGDGYSDVFVVRHVHNPYMKDAYDYRTHFWIFLGWRGGIATVPHPEMARTWYGRRHGAPKETVATVTDVDGDGFADLIGSEVALDGDLFLLEGGAGGPSKAPKRIPKGEGKLWFGYPRAIGDVNADGYDDVVVRSVDDILGHPHVWLYRGGSHGLPLNPSTTWYFFPRL